MADSVNGNETEMKSSNDHDNYYDCSDEDEYIYEEDDDDDDDICAISVSGRARGGTSDALADQFCGLRYEGVLSNVVAVANKNAVYPIYKQLAEFAAVEVEEHFLAAQITIPVKDEVIIMEIEFPQKPPFFPDAPPKIELKCRFAAPYQHFNIVFNNHPQLLRHKWNLCTDIVQIFRDAAEIGRKARVIMCDSDKIDFLYQNVISIMRVNSIDVTGLFPEAQFSSLPSFGIRKDNEANKASKHSGIGYSERGVSTAWKFSSYANTKIENLLTIAATQRMSSTEDDAEPNETCHQTNIRHYRKNKLFDPVILDCVCYIMSALLSDTVTLDEFFRSLSFYDSAVSCLLSLPLPSPHIPMPVGLFHVQDQINALGEKFILSLEANELGTVQRLEALCRYYKAAGKKRHLQSGDGDMGVKSSGNRSVPVHPVASADCYESTAVSGTEGEHNDNSVADTLQRVIRVDTEFKHHLYSKKMNDVGHLPAKWMRRLNIELASLPDSLPENVIVFSGIECNQPNLMKVLMFPECEETPYCGGCFEFDIFIGPEYPQEPPKMLLVTTGGGSVRFNPNLYQCGKVCLSLLGTWQGEKWDPNVSSLTQVINSILFLIFVEEPYFNEPGFEVDRDTEWGKRKSRDYNRNIRIQTLRFAYLEHLKSKQAPLSAWIIPQLKRNWQTKGSRVAQMWLDELSSGDDESSSDKQISSSSGYDCKLLSVAEQKKQLSQLIAKIDAAVQS